MPGGVSARAADVSVCDCELRLLCSAGNAHVMQSANACKLAGL
jgi:hypothetical protein